MDNQEPRERAMSSELSSDHGFGADRHDLGCRVVHPVAGDEPHLVTRVLRGLTRALGRRASATPGGDNAALSRIAAAPRESAGARN